MAMRMCSCTRTRAPDNLRAQQVYERIGAARAEWVEYSLPTGRV